MAVGLPLKTTYANGDVYSASDVNDTNGTVNLFTSSTLSRAAGKNIIINGGMDVWQRGTSFSIAASTYPAWSADRWLTSTNANQACTLSRQATGDTTNLPSIQYALRYQRNSGQTGTGTLALVQNVETANTIPLAGKPVTLSFYARRGANYSAASNALTIFLTTGTGTDQNYFGGGYSGSAYPVSGQTATLTTTWQRFTYTGTFDSTATECFVYFGFTPTGTAGAADYFEVTGVQVEVGSTATTFSRTGGTIQGELAACQRYYQRAQNTSVFAGYGFGTARSTTQVDILINLTVPMRTAPTAIDYSTLNLSNPGVAGFTMSNLVLDSTSNSVAMLLATSSGLTQYRSYLLNNNNSTAGYLGFTAEL